MKKGAKVPKEKVEMKQLHKTFCCCCFYMKRVTALLLPLSHQLSFLPLCFPVSNRKSGESQKVLKMLIQFQLPMHISKCVLAPFIWSSPLADSYGHIRSQKENSIISSHTFLCCGWIWQTGRERKYLRDRNFQGIYPTCNSSTIKITKDKGKMCWFSILHCFEFFKKLY